MGLLNFLKRTYTEEYDLEDLEDLVYDDEHLDEASEEVEDKLDLSKAEKYDMAQLFDGFDIGEKKKSVEEEIKPATVDSKTKKKQEAAKKEEEKYDHLLNSIQAQTLIKTVESINDKKEKAKQERIERVNKEEPSRRTEIEEKSAEVKKDNILGIVLPDVTRKPKKLEQVDTKKFKTSEVELYVKSQCDIMEEAATYIENARYEYDVVTEQFNDAQLIEEAPTDVRNRISNVAEVIDTMAVDRRMFKSTEQKLSNSAYRRMESFENEMPRGLKLLKASEDYYDSVSQDMKMLEGERLSLRLEAKHLVKRQMRISSIAKTTFVALAIVFVVLIFALVAAPEDINKVLFLYVVFLSAVLALGMFALLKTTERKVLLCEIKLNKATAILNKIKIKYINAANTLDYEYNKYDVDSAHELDTKYGLYLEMKAEQKKMLDLTSNLNSAETDLENELRRLNLYDTHVWLSQIKALYNPKEMVEVKHELTIKRQKLRSQIEFNEGRIKEAKQNIKNITVSNPEYSADAIKVVEMYEKKHRK